MCVCVSVTNAATLKEWLFMSEHTGCSLSSEQEVTKHLAVPLQSVTRLALVCIKHNDECTLILNYVNFT